MTVLEARNPAQRDRTLLRHDSDHAQSRLGEDGRFEGWKIVRFGSAQEMLEGAARMRADAIAVSLDQTSPRYDSAFQSLRERHPDVILIALLNAQSVDSDPVRNLVGRVFDAWLPSPYEEPELLSCLRCVDRMNQLRTERHRNGNPTGDRYGLHGRSAAIRKLLNSIERFKDSDASVLIVGETGTGKELVARAIHEGSPRAEGPLIALNCGAIPASLIQSELFGHEKNAFTGAAQRRFGSFEAADRGSVFLDEIGELPLEMQPALLRVLQERSVTRLGSTRPVPVDFRLIAATHVDLPAAVAAGRFREDLLFRINVLTLYVPPLREREDDVMVLAERFRDEFAAGLVRVRPRGFSQDAIRQLRQYRWPGNVRELINRVQRAVLMADGRLISAADLGFATECIPSDRITLAQARSHFERGLIRDTLRETGHCMASAARLLGVSRVTLYRMVDRLGLDDATPDSAGAGRVSVGHRVEPVSELIPARFIS